MAAIMRIFFVSTFVGTFLPASVGGDAVRAYSLSRWNVRAGDAIASVFMDRMLGVTSILLMALVGLFSARDLIANVTIVTALGVAALASTMTLVLIFSARAESALSPDPRPSAGTVRHPGNRWWKPCAGTPRITVLCWVCWPAPWRSRFSAFSRRTCSGAV
jgi:uncharacterized membrane protein YbhN (UPF0104 family)